MRCAIAVVGTLLVLSSPLASSDERPRLVHLAWTGEAYRVSFWQPTEGPVVAWSAARGEGETTATPAPGPDGGLHFADLPSDATAYRVDGRAHALDAPPGPDATVRVAFLADVGTSDDSLAVWRAVEEAGPDMVLVGGDLSYAHGDEATWRAWLATIEPLASTTPVMVAFGNHERYCGGYRTCEDEPARYAEYFHMPNAPHRYYAFDWGPMSFVALDTEAYHPRDGYEATDPAAQRAFLEDRLCGADGAWRVVWFHRPLHSTADPPMDDDAAREDVGPVLDACGADLVLAGHAHAYERFAQLREGAVVDRSDDVVAGNGWVHVVSGGGGRSLYEEFGERDERSVERAAEFHFLLVEAAPGRLDVRAVRPDGSELDAFGIHRPVRPVEEPDAGPPGPEPEARPPPDPPPPPVEGDDAPAEAPEDAPPPSVPDLAVVDPGARAAPGVGVASLAAALAASRALRRRRP